VSDFGDYALSVWPDITWLLFALCAALAGIWCLRAALAIARGGRFLGSLMDRGDGQGGVPLTRPMDLGGLVISREQDDHNAWLASCPTGAIGDATQPIDPDPGDGCTWCKPGTLRAWPCACAGECGDPACAPAVRHG